MVNLKGGIVLTAIVVLFMAYCVNNCSPKVISFAVGVGCITAFCWGMYMAFLGIKEDEEKKKKNEK